MLSENMIVRTGSGLATAYAGANTEFISDLIPLSSASRDLMKYLDLPLIKRKPTTYDSGLLFYYQPNSTFLLPIRA